MHNNPRYNTQITTHDSNRSFVVCLHSYRSLQDGDQIRVHAEELRVIKRSY